MSQKVCKWCGREFDSAGRSASGAGGWATCSESCRLNLQASVDTGATTKNESTSLVGWLGRLLVVALVIGFLNKGCRALSGTSTPQTEAAAPTEATAPAATEDSTPPVAEPTAEAEDGEVNESEGEIRAIPAPEEATLEPAGEEGSSAESSLTAF